jgi:hypothetical protein
MPSAFKLRNDLMNADEFHKVRLVRARPAQFTLLIAVILSGCTSSV